MPSPDRPHIALSRISIGQQSLRTIPTFGDRTLTLNLPPGLSQAILNGLLPNRSGEPQRLSSGAMDHPTSHRLESSTHHSQIFNNRNEAEPIRMKPSRRQRLSGCERSQCKSAGIRAEGPIWRRDGPYAVNHYPNTDRMKTTVQYSPQVALEGMAPCSNPYP